MLFMNIKDRKKLINREIFEKENNDIEKARSFCKEVQKLGKKYNLSYFFVTEGASCTCNNGNPAIRAARLHHEEWEKQNGYDPHEDWG